MMDPVNLLTKHWKRAVQIALLVVVALDAGLLLFRWHLETSASQQQLRTTADTLRLETAKLKANLNEAIATRKRLPEIARDCDSFFSDDLLDVKSGYASLVGDLGEIASKAGLQSSGVHFQQEEVKDRGVVRVEANATVEGDYPALIRFVNGLERSKDFYLLDSLSLVSNAPGRIKLNVKLRTYFRS